MKVKQFVQFALFLGILIGGVAGCNPQESAQLQPSPTKTLPIETSFPVISTATRMPSATITPIGTPTNTTVPVMITHELDYDLLNVPDQAELILIPAGEFQMGSVIEDVMGVCAALGIKCEPFDFADETPAHPVSLDAYYIYQFEVTNRQYRLCVDAGACSPPEFGEFYNDARFLHHPVVFVSWFDASDYCTWAGGRLPTEAEWEYAARGMDGRTFPWGDTASCGFGNYSGCTEGLTNQIGSYLTGVSPFDIYDMSGNVTEWVEDWYAPDYYGHSPNVNPTGPEEGEMRAARGGSWKNPILGMRITDRAANFPDVYSSGTGFRCVISPES